MCLRVRADQLARDKPFISIASDESLLKAVRMLIENRVHRLPVVDRAAGNVLYILTHKRLLKFLYLYVRLLSPPTASTLTWTCTCTPPVPSLLLTSRPVPSRLMQPYTLF